MLSHERGSLLLPKRATQRGSLSAPSFSFEHLLFLKAVRPLPRLPVTSILPYVFPSIIFFRKQILRKIWPIKLGFLLFIVCKICLTCLTPCNTSSFFTRSVQLIFYATFHTFKEFLIYFPKCQRFSTKQAMLLMQHYINIFLKFVSRLLVIKILSLLKAKWSVTVTKTIFKKLTLSQKFLYRIPTQKFIKIRRMVYSLMQVTDGRKNVFTT